MDFTGKLTPLGAALLAKTLANGTPLTVTRVMAGSGVTGEDAAALTQPRQTVTVSDRTSDGSLSTIMVTLAANLAECPYSLTELGVYATDPELGEILYQIFTLDAPVEITPDSRLVLRTYLRLCVSDELEVALSLPPSGLLVEADVKNKADLVDGQVPYVQTSHLNGYKILYVDAGAGDDVNPGTEERPFRTIQAAVDSLPRDLGRYSVTIFLKPGTYHEIVRVSGFHGGDYKYALTIRGAGSLEEAAAYVVDGIFISHNSCNFEVYGMTFTGGYLSGYGSGVAVVASFARFVDCAFRCTEDFAGEVGINILWSASRVCMIRCEVDGYQDGVGVSENAVASIISSTVKNCQTGILVGRWGSDSCGIIMGDSTVKFENNTTNLLKYNAGCQIFGMEGME